MKINTSNLRVGIAGYGVVGKRRRQIIDQHLNLKTIAVCDITFGESGTMSDGVRFHAHYSKLLEEALDILFISLPNYLAPEVTIAGIEKGLHVFCEKPPGRTVEDIEQVIKVEKANPGLLLKYGFNHRYHNSVRKALEIIESKQFGEIVNLRGVYGKSKIVPFMGEWRAEREMSGGGILLDQGIHMVDLIRLFGGEFSEVKSFVSNNYWNFDVEDNAYAIMRNKEDKFAILHSSATQWQHKFTLDIALTNGYLQLNGLLTSSKSYGEETLIVGNREDSVKGSLTKKTIKYLDDNSWHDEVYEFADAVINGCPIENGNSYDALATMKLVYRIYYSDSEWRETYNISNPDKTQP